MSTIVIEIIMIRNSAGIQMIVLVWFKHIIIKLLIHKLHTFMNNIFCDLATLPLTEIIYFVEK
jgi:hypothetical protein